MFEVGVAINCIANICTPDLARDLLSDTATMLTSSRPYIRKKATLAMYKLYLQCALARRCAGGGGGSSPAAVACARRYPQGLRLTFEQLRAKLGDENVSVQSCAVNVICELANKKPKNYLMLAQELFALLGTSHNNWMLIKVAKVRRGVRARGDRSPIGHAHSCSGPSWRRSRAWRGSCSNRSRTSSLSRLLSR